MLFNTLFTITSAQNQPDIVRDGKLLQGEQWLPFSYPAKADFYISSKGNDDWSGTLPDPNAGMTDGPFLTIGRVLSFIFIEPDSNLD